MCQHLTSPLIVFLFPTRDSLHDVFRIEKDYIQNNSYIVFDFFSKERNKRQKKSESNVKKICEYATTLNECERFFPLKDNTWSGWGIAITIIDIVIVQMYHIFKCAQNTHTHTRTPNKIKHLCIARCRRVHSHVIIKNWIALICEF